jgi:tartrate dehydratase beta subunit/fumarate hydratase class I family protein
LETDVSIANSTVTNGTTFVSANSEYQFTVTYRDASGINLATLDNNDIKVLAPNGTLQNATLVSTTSSSDRKTVTATYKIFDVGIIGQYSILLQENQVSDINYNFLASQNIGLFSVGTLYTSVESTGNTKLVKDSSNKFYAQVASNTPVAIKNGTIQVYEGIYAGWQILAAETINGVNQVLWKNAGSNTMQVWQMNNNWERVSTQSITLNSSAALAQETVFGVDANEDGTIGTLYTSVESAGNTKLVKDSNNRFYAQVGGNAPVAIRNSTTQIYEGISAGWQTLAAETVNGVNQVLWKNAGSNAMHVWQMNSRWERVSTQIIGTLTSSAALAQEIIFGVDANGDGIIG